MDALRAFAARRRVDLDLAIERVIGRCEAQLAFAATEEGGEDPQEILLDGRERLHEEVARRAVDLPDREYERLPCTHQVIALRDEKVEPLALFGMLLHRESVYGTDRLERGNDACRLRLQRLQVQVEQGRTFEQLVQRFPPFRLDALGNAAAESRSLGEPYAQRMMLLVHRVETGTGTAQRALRVREGRRRRGERLLRRGRRLLELEQGAAPAVPFRFPGHTARLQLGGFRRDHLELGSEARDRRLGLDPGVLGALMTLSGGADARGDMRLLYLPLCPPFTRRLLLAFELPEAGPARCDHFLGSRSHLGALGKCG